MTLGVWFFPTVSTSQPDASPSQTSRLLPVSTAIAENISQSQGMISVCMTRNSLFSTPYRQESLPIFKNIMTALLNHNCYTKTHIYKRGDMRKPLQVMDMSIALIVVMVSWMYVQTHKIVYINTRTILICKAEFFKNEIKCIHLKHPTYRPQRLT